MSKSSGWVQKEDTLAFKQFYLFYTTRKSDVSFCVQKKGEHKKNSKGDWTRTKEDEEEMGHRITGTVHFQRNQVKTACRR